MLLAEGTPLNFGRLGSNRALATKSRCKPHEPRPRFGNNSDMSGTPSLPLRDFGVMAFARGFDTFGLWSLAIRAFYGFYGGLEQGLSLGPTSGLLQNSNIQLRAEKRRAGVESMHGSQLARPVPWD